MKFVILLFLRVTEDQETNAQPAPIPEPEEDAISPIYRHEEEEEENDVLETIDTETSKRASKQEDTFDETDNDQSEQPLPTLIQNAVSGLVLGQDKSIGGVSIGQFIHPELEDYEDAMNDSIQSMEEVKGLLVALQSKNEQNRKKKNQEVKPLIGKFQTQSELIRYENDYDFS